MPQSRTVTTSQGPSAQNQTSMDHSLDSNQHARQPSMREIIQDEELDKEAGPSDADISSANVD